jgi:serine phosphatase RsbU (regulator of sigma subunit)
MSFCSYSLNAQPIETNELGEGKLIGKNIEYFEDKDSKLPFSEINSVSMSGQFIKSEKDVLNFGQTGFSYWLRFQFKNNRTEKIKFILEIDYGNLDIVEFYSPNLQIKTNSYDFQKAGKKFPFSERKWIHRNFLYSIEVPSGISDYYYIRTRTKGGLVFPMRLWEETSFFNHDSNVLLGLGFYFGIIFVMLFYNFFIFVSVKDISYLFYIGYIFGLMGIQIVLTGLGFQHIWPNYPWFQQHLYVIFSAISMSCSLLFAKSFLNIRQIAPKLEKIMNLLILTNLLLLPGIFFIPHEISIKAALILSFPSLLFSLYSGFVSLSHNYRPARYYVLAFTLLIVSSLFVVLKFLNVIESNFLSDYGLYIGSCLEVILLSFALASRINSIKKEKEEAQTAALQMQQELLDTQIRNSDTLEIRVAERTLQLNNSLDLIRKDLSIAKKIQQNTLMIDFKMIEELEIIPFYLAMAEVGGDFYGINKLNNNKYRFFLADATGHGVQAALITMAIKGIYDRIKTEPLNVAELLEKFNKEFIQEYSGLNTYLTCLVADIDIASQVLEFASAGHPPCMLIQGKDYSLLSRTGRMIGLRKDSQYISRTFDFKKEDRVYFFTDGVFEEFNEAGEEFGEERLHSILLECREVSIEMSIQELKKQLYSFLGTYPMQDDFTILGIGYR